MSYAYLGLLQIKSKILLFILWKFHRDVPNGSKITDSFPKKVFREHSALFYLSFSLSMQNFFKIFLMVQNLQKKSFFLCRTLKICQQTVSKWKQSRLTMWQQLKWTFLSKIFSLPTDILYKFYILADNIFWHLPYCGHNNYVFKTIII